jgi:hypothetical protein
VNYKKVKNEQKHVQFPRPLLCDSQKESVINTSNKAAIRQNQEHADDSGGRTVIFGPNDHFSIFSMLRLPLPPPPVITIPPDRRLIHPMLEKEGKNIYKASAPIIKAVSPRNPETVTAEAPEAGEMEPEGDGTAGLLTRIEVRLAQVMRPPALLWMTIERLPMYAPIPCLVEM